MGEGLVAVTRTIPGDFDLVELASDGGVLWATEGTGLVGLGVAARISVPPGDPAAAAGAVSAALGSIEAHDELQVPGSGAVALGALPFDSLSEGELIVPEVLVGRSADGGAWITTVGSGVDQGDLDVLRRAARRIDGPEVGGACFRVAADRDPADWCASVEAVRTALARGEARKVVLARSVSVEADVDHSASRLVRRLAATYPGCMIYMVEGLVGASPELLVSRSGDVVRSHPMAGTTRRSPDPLEDAELAAALLRSTKDQAEHRITIDMVHETLLPWCSYLDEEAEASVVAMANVQHLATRVEGLLSEPVPSVLELVRALHPTPAVCGAPRDEALRLIALHEGLDRGRYAGPVGWVDARGDGAWAVGIRCAELAGRLARVFAGVGVVEDSDPSSELAETRAKLQAVLGALVQP